MNGTRKQKSYLRNFANVFYFLYHSTSIKYWSGFLLPEIFL